MNKPVVMLSSRSTFRHQMCHKLYKDTCFWKKCYPKYIVNYDFLCQEENIVYPYVTPYHPCKDPPKGSIGNDDIYSVSLQTVFAVPVDFTDSLTGLLSLVTQTEAPPAG